MNNQEPDRRRITHAGILADGHYHQPVLAHAQPRHDDLPCASSTRPRCSQPPVVVVEHNCASGQPLTPDSDIHASIQIHYVKRLDTRRRQWLRRYRGGRRMRGRCRWRE